MSEESFLFLEKNSPKQCTIEKQRRHKICSQTFSAKIVSLHVRRQIHTSKTPSNSEALAHRRFCLQRVCGAKPLRTLVRPDASFNAVLRARDCSLLSCGAIEYSGFLLTLVACPDLTELTIFVPLHGQFFYFVSACALDRSTCPPLRRWCPRSNRAFDTTASKAHPPQYAQSSSTQIDLNSRSGTNVCLLKNVAQPKDMSHIKLAGDVFMVKKLHRFLWSNDAPRSSNVIFNGSWGVTFGTWFLAQDTLACQFG